MGGEETWEQLSGPLGRVLEQIRARAEGSGRAVASSVETEPKDTGSNAHDTRDGRSRGPSGG
jgi:hypothetical protein